MSGSLEERALAGDKAAWNILIKKHEFLVLNHILRQKVPLSKAREILQEVWIILFSKRQQLSSLHLPGLAIRQADFLVLDFYGMVKTEEELDEKNSRQSHDLEDIIRIREILSDCLSQLSDRNRQIFDYTYQDGKSSEEIAKLTGLTAPHVRKIRSEIRKQIKELLEQK